jgi:hypothetical protein
MSDTLAAYLALILFAPWFVILLWVYWRLPRPPGSRWTRAHDAVLVVAAFLVSAVAGHLAFAIASDTEAAIWPQVLASLFVYAAFMAVMLLAGGLRWHAAKRVKQDRGQRA